MWGRENGRIGQRPSEWQGIERVVVQAIVVGNCMSGGQW